MVFDASNIPWQFAIRELHNDLRRSKTWIIFASVSAILCLSGPFETGETLGLPRRAVYWSVVVILTYCIGSTVARLTQVFLEPRGFAVMIIVQAIFSSVVISLLINTLNRLFFGSFPATGMSAALLYASILVICLAVHTTIQMLWPSGAQAPDKTATPSLQDRLPVEKRGSLLAISSEDHYVRIITDAGETLLRMRFSDATREAATTDAGLQVHRSHWVATRQVAKVARNGSRWQAVLKNGTAIPISRGHMDDVKKAGLLPGS